MPGDAGDCGWDAVYQDGAKVDRGGGEGLNVPATAASISLTVSLVLRRKVLRTLDVHVIDAHDFPAHWIAHHSNVQCSHDLHPFGLIEDRHVSVRGGKYQFLHFWPVPTAFTAG